MLNRRSFLIGLGTAIAAAAIVEPATLLTPLPTHVFKVRRIRGLTMGFTSTSTSPEYWLAANSIGTFEMRRHGAEYSLMRWDFNQGTTCRWTACGAENEIIVPAKEIIDLDLQMAGTPNTGIVTLDCLDTIDDGPPVPVVETHRFDGKLHSTEMQFLYADNSLEARLRREEDHKQLLLAEQTIKEDYDDFSECVDDD